MNPDVLELRKKYGIPVSGVAPVASQDVSRVAENRTANLDSAWGAPDTTSLSSMREAFQKRGQKYQDIQSTDYGGTDAYNATARVARQIPNLLGGVYDVAKSTPIVGDIIGGVEKATGAIAEKGLELAGETTTGKALKFAAQKYLEMIPPEDKVMAKMKVQEILQKPNVQEGIKALEDLTAGLGVIEGGKALGDIAAGGGKKLIKAISNIDADTPIIPGIRKTPATPEAQILARKQSQEATKQYIKDTATQTMTGRKKLDKTVRLSPENQDTQDAIDILIDDIAGKSDNPGEYLFEVKDKKMDWTRAANALNRDKEIYGPKLGEFLESYDNQPLSHTKLSDIKSKMKVTAGSENKRRQLQKAIDDRFAEYEDTYGTRNLTPAEINQLKSELYETAYDAKETLKKEADKMVAKALKDEVIARTDSDTVRKLLKELENRNRVLNLIKDHRLDYTLAGGRLPATISRATAMTTGAIAGAPGGVVGSLIGSIVGGESAEAVAKYLVDKKIDRISKDWVRSQLKDTAPDLLKQVDNIVAKNTEILGLPSPKGNLQGAQTFGARQIDLPERTQSSVVDRPQVTEYSDKYPSGIKRDYSYTKEWEDSQKAILDDREEFIRNLDKHTNEANIQSTLDDIDAEIQRAETHADIYRDELRGMEIEKKLSQMRKMMKEGTFSDADVGLKMTPDRAKEFGYSDTQINQSRHRNAMMEELANQGKIQHGEWDERPDLANEFADRYESYRDQLRSAEQQIRELKQKQRDYRNSKYNPTTNETMKPSSIESSNNTTRLVSEEAYKKALARFQSNSKRLLSGVPVDQIADFAIISAYHIENGVRTVAEFGRKLAEEGYKLSKEQIEKLFNKAYKDVHGTQHIDDIINNGIDTIPDSVEPLKISQYARRKIHEQDLNVLEHFVYQLETTRQLGDIPDDVFDYANPLLEKLGIDQDLPKAKLAQEIRKYMSGEKDFIGTKVPGSEAPKNKVDVPSQQNSIESEAKKYKTTINIQDKNDLKYLKQIFNDDIINDIKSGKMENWQGRSYSDIGKINIIDETPKTISQELEGRITIINPASRTFYHGTSSENAKNIINSGFKTGASLPKNTFRGGGYDRLQNSISFAETPREASIFSSLTKGGEIIEVKLNDNAKVVSIKGIDDAIELEDYIDYLKKQKVDAVYIGGGEKELVVLNPKSVTPIKSQLTEIWNKAHNKK